MQHPNSPKPSLNDARARVDRASEHIDRLWDNLTVMTREQWEGLRVTSAVTPFEAPPIISILIGEIVYNLKAALDISPSLNMAWRRF